MTWADSAWFIRLFTLSSALGIRARLNKQGYEINSLHRSNLAHTSKTPRLLVWLRLYRRIIILALKQTWFAFTRRCRIWYLLPCGSTTQGCFGDAVPPFGSFPCSELSTLQFIQASIEDVQRLAEGGEVTPR